MATSTSKNKRRQTPAVQGPKQRGQPARPWWLHALVGLGLVVVGGLLFVLMQSDGGPPTTEGLPDTPDYHSLLVSPTDADTLVLGTHDGLFRSADGGRTWERDTLGGRDAMNLARPGSGPTVWAAGHNVLARSADGGATWADVRPTGLPGLDVHGFAVDPQTPSTVYAAIAGQGLYRSTDGGESFVPISTEVGPGVMALAVAPGGTLLAGDMQRRALMSSEDGGTTWRSLIDASVMGLAVNPRDGRRVLASGPGVLVSTDGGGSWRQALRLEDGTGPIAWAPTDPRVAYVVGFDRSLFRSDDRGETWALVEGGS